MTTGASVWDTPAEATAYREEIRENGGHTFKVTRRALTFPEETRLLAKCTDQETKRVDWLEFLAGVVNLTVKENDFHLTPQRCREDLPSRPALAWFLVRWLCADTMANVAPDAVEELRKKPGP